MIISLLELSKVTGKKIMEYKLFGKYYKKYKKTPDCNANRRGENKSQTEGGYVLLTILLGGERLISCLRLHILKLSYQDV